MNKNKTACDIAMSKHKWSTYQDAEGDAWRAGFHHGFGAGEEFIRTDSIEEFVRRVFSNRPDADFIPRSVIQSVKAEMLKEEQDG